MILHIFGLSIFSGPFINFYRENLSEIEYYFYLTGDARKHPYSKGNDTTLLTSRAGYLKLIVRMYKADKVILHSLFDVYILLALFFNPWLIKKCYWIIWGSDLYRYREPRDSVKKIILEFIRQFVIKRMGHLVTYVPGDVELARKWYKAKGVHHSCVMYPSNVFSPILTLGPPAHKDKGAIRKILLGNSATPSNNHLSIIDKLSENDLSGWQVITPLSYGDESYAANVIRHGAKLIGQNFMPVTRLLAYEEYLSLLQGIDIALFDHDKQQGMGNIITLLGMGKTVFMRTNISSAKMLSSLGLKFFDIEKFELTEITETEKKTNIRIIADRFSKQSLTEDWKKIIAS